MRLLCSNGPPIRDGDQVGFQIVEDTVEPDAERETPAGPAPRADQHPRHRLGSSRAFAVIGTGSTHQITMRSISSTVTVSAVRS